MSLPALLALLLGLSLTAYALLAGADFGAGILDLLAGRRSPDRSVIANAIGPIWEANHVWLIFSITILFSAFPAAFSALGTGLLAPVTIALLAIGLRGAAWGLRSGQDTSSRAYVRLSRLFGVASLVAPLLLGAVAGGLAEVSSSTAIDQGGSLSIPWTGGFAITSGLLAVCLCVQLAATFLAARLQRGRQVGAAERFRRRALQSGLSVSVISIAGLAIAASSAPTLADRLMTAALPIVVAGFAALGLSLVTLARRRYRVARGATLVSAALLVWGWFIAQSPRLIGPRFTIASSAASHAALVAVAIALGVVLIAVIPAFALLWGMSERIVPEAK
jgi:cytochrome bd ubiquinol oxidase subunit II